MNHGNLFRIAGLIFGIGIFSLLVSCGSGEQSVGTGGELQAIAQARGLTPADLLAAAKTRFGYIQALYELNLAIATLSRTVGIALDKTS